MHWDWYHHKESNQHTIGCGVMAVLVSSKVVKQCILLQDNQVLLMGVFDLEFLWDKAWERGVGQCKGSGEAFIKK